MKALEILKECLENEKDIMKGYENLSNIDYIQEAIAELEALQAPKTCSSCYHSLIFDNSHRRCSIIYINDDCGDPTAVVPNNFSCGYYEPKDNS